MKGSLPINYIVAIVLAVAVLALLGYWYYTSGGKFSTGVNRQECLTLKMRYCAEWGAQGYKTPIPTPPGSWDSYENKKGEACSTQHKISVSQRTDC